MFSPGKSTVFVAPFGVALQHKSHRSPVLPEPFLRVAAVPFQAHVL
jgi:hypothetical protein